jgi:hypothetical protein
MTIKQCVYQAVQFFCFHLLTSAQIRARKKKKLKQNQKTKAREQSNNEKNV